LAVDLVQPLSGRAVETLTKHNTVGQVVVALGGEWYDGVNPWEPRLPRRDLGTRRSMLLEVGWLWLEVVVCRGITPAVVLEDRRVIEIEPVESTEYSWKKEFVAMGECNLVCSNSDRC
jgi:hypothetical protein